MNRTIPRIVVSAIVIMAAALLAWRSFAPPSPPAATHQSASPASRPAVTMILEATVTEPEMEPWGVAGDDDGRIYVADHAAGRLLVFDDKGKCVASSDSIEGQSGCLVEPVGVAWNGRTKRVYVADSGHDRVAVFFPDGRMDFTFGTSGPGDGQFSRPVGVACDAEGRIFVVQVENSRLQVFDSSGRFLEGHGSDELGMDFLWDVTCLRNGGFALTSALGGLAEYNGDFSPVSNLAERGIGPGRYLFTTGLSSDDRGRVVFCAKTQGKVMLVEAPSDTAPRGTVISEICSVDSPGFGMTPPPLLSTYGTSDARRAMNRHLRHRLRFPMDVAFLPGGRLAVAERGNRRLLVFRETTGG